jgi:KDO2-lipid IV(A) lauroyltransferase
MHAAPQLFVPQCGFMRRRSALRNLVEYSLALAAVKSLELAPLPLAWRLARVYTGLLDRAVPRLRRVALRNLSFALPELDDRARSAIADGVFHSIARMLVVFARFPSIGRENLDRWLRCEGMEHVESAFRQGRGILFATAHLGNWELSAYGFSLLREPMSVVARALDNPLIDRLVERRRGLSGNRLIYKKDFARSILKTLSANGAVGILIDQNASEDSGVFVDFFGVPACAGTGFAKLAAHSGAAVIPGFALWSDTERRYVLCFGAALPMTGDAAADTRALQARLEEVIRSYPDQWLWIHRRWKTRPPGEPSVYGRSPEAA